MKPIRLLIVDDSPTVQSVLTSILSEHTDIQIVGTAFDPYEAKDLILKTRPDVITLDIEMPRMDGISFLKRLMSFRPVPVIMISSFTRENSRRTMEALNAGAVDFVAKPTGDVRTGLRELEREITSKVRAATRAKIKPSILFGKPEKTLPMATIGASNKIIAIGASTGGTRAIRRVLGGMPSNINGVAIVQHMAARFTNTFAETLNESFPMDIKEAEQGDRLDTGKVLVSPGGQHLHVAKDHKGYYVRLQDGRPVKYQRPSVDVFFHSVARMAGRDAIGIVLTGMGDDGADGLLAMKQAGAFTIAQDEATSVVFGMPGSAIARGAVEIVAPLDEIADIVLSRLIS
ncbi:MAG TPA: chemotaxis response regulator protein-glutamate methylesterase [Desulfobacterales bacterium]|jgi:two-component system chemotaxis response regulator CheB|nr:chemotaxis response regulator protein-glutamate methylesterase [Desulfobacterales bacterium]